ncbi:unnamed protein product [Ectocarpus sp. 4 AP-2014]
MTLCFHERTPAGSLVFPHTLSFCVPQNNNLAIPLTLPQLAAHKLSPQLGWASRLLRGKHRGNERTKNLLRKRKPARACGHQPLYTKLFGWKRRDKSQDTRTTKEKTAKHYQKPRTDQHASWSTRLAVLRISFNTAPPLPLKNQITRYVSASPV